MIKQCPKCKDISLDYDILSNKWICVWLNCHYEEKETNLYYTKTIQVIYCDKCDCLREAIFFKPNIYVCKVCNYKEIVPLERNVL